MLILGHPGITLGSAILLTGLTSSIRKKKVRVVAPCSPPSHRTAASDCHGTDKVSWVESLAKYADIRLLLVGSLLPDIIDKPVGQFFLRATFSNGRIFSHSLITIIGLYLYRYRSKTWLLVLSFGTFTHLVLDQMWRAPHTLLWPIYGFAFEKTDLTGWVPNMFHALITEPMVYLPELVGGVILVWFAQSLMRRRRVLAFLKYGKV
jgi:membrane-bound metal-dependent hydrolase YbcI (DUF457 family)